MNVAELSQALADLYAGQFYSIWTVYWVTRFLLNCLVIVLNYLFILFHVSELSQALADLYARSIWNVYRVTRFLLDCLLFVLNVAELLQALAKPFARWFYSSWTDYWVTWLWLNLVIWL